MIKVENLCKSYSTRQGPREILKNVNLTIKKGEKVGILGRNGAGKSTLVRLLGGIERPTSGRVRRTMSLSWPIAFGGAFQNSLTGMDNLRFICRVYGVSAEDKLDFVYNFSELGSYMREPVKTYSSGMKARLAFALSMAIEFDCYLIDETMAVGDRRFHSKCNHELFEVRKDRSIILVSHLPNQIRDHCNVFYVLHEGQITHFNDVDEAYEFYEAQQ